MTDKIFAGYDTCKHCFFNFRALTSLFYLKGNNRFLSLLSILCTFCLVLFYLKMYNSELLCIFTSIHGKCGRQYLKEQTDFK